MTYENLAPAFLAFGDPVRRQLVQRLAGRPQSVGELAIDLQISPPAVSQHLKHLKNAGLVTDHALGTRRIYRLNPRGIGTMREWLDLYW